MIKQQIEKNRWQVLLVFLKTLGISVVTVYFIFFGTMWAYYSGFNYSGRDYETDNDLTADFISALAPAFHSVTKPIFIALPFIIAIGFWICLVVGTNILIDRNNITKWMKENKAVPYKSKKETKLTRVVNELSSKAKIIVPAIYVIDDPAPNSFAVGKNKEHSAIAVTSGLVKILNEDELAVVIAHEMANICNGGTRLMMTFFYANRGVWDLGLGAVMAIGSMLDQDNDSPNWVLTIIAAIILLPLLIFGSIGVFLSSKIFCFYLPQSYEYYADAGAVELTEKKQTVIKTLQRFRQIQRPMSDVSIYYRIYYVSPDKKKKGDEKQAHWQEQLPLVERINRVQKVTIK